MLACRKREGSFINTIIQLQQKSYRLRRMHFVKVVNELLLWSPDFGGIVCRSPGCLEWLLGESRVTLDTCKEERCVHPVQVKGCDNGFPGQLVSDVAGVVVPHQLIETLTPPRGQMQSHVEGVLSLRCWVPPAEPIPLNLGCFLLLFLADNSKNFGLIVCLL